jgi:hypothetical protein
MLKTTTKLDLDKDNQIKIVLAIEDPGQNGDNSVANSTGAWGALPNFAGQLAYTSKTLGFAPSYAGVLSPFTVNAFGIYGHSHYNFSTAGTPASVVPGGDGGVTVIPAVPGVTVPNAGKDSYGYGLYALVPILRSSDGKNRANTASFEGEISYASNLAFDNGTANGFTSSGIGTFSEAGAPNSAIPLKDLGIAGQLEYYPTQSLGLTAGYGSRRAANSDSAFAAGQQYIVQSQEIYFNAAYDLNSAIRVAAEYQNLQETYGNTNAAGTASAGSYKSIDNIGRLNFYYFF